MNWLYLACWLAVLGLLMTGCGNLDSYHCTQWWYDEGGHPENLGERARAQRINRCRDKPPQDDARRYDVIRGKPYLVVTEVSTQAKRSLIGGLPTGGHDIHFHVHYYRIEANVNLDKLRTWQQHGRNIQGYASDGNQVFYMTTAIRNADPATFEVLDARFDARLWAPWHHPWARDGQRVYYQGREVPGARPDDLRYVTRDLLVSSGRVLDAHHAGYRERGATPVTERPDMDTSLHRINAGYTADRQYVYFFGKRMALADPQTFRPLVPVCPVPGHPLLECVHHQVAADRLMHGESEVAIPGKFLGRDRDNVYINDEALLLQGEDGRFNRADGNDLHVFWLCPRGGCRRSDQAGASNDARASELYAVTSGRLLWLDSLRGPKAVRGVAYRGALSSVPEDDPNSNSRWLRDDIGLIEVSPILEGRLRRAEWGQVHFSYSTTQSLPTDYPGGRPAS